ncbi:sialidase family protein [Nonomuraea sp. NPDC050790]|uniref:sialidase family protein n=1 Tax=Nonomuraea sp. NPDC050790 TaxID=3364371 RepID=UPI003796F20D
MDVDVAGPGVSGPVTVFADVRTLPGGEPAHEGNRVPDVAVLGERRIVVGWRAGVSGPAEPREQGSIGLAVSHDGGRTWTPGTLAPATATHRYHYVIFLNDGAALYAFLGRITLSGERADGGELDGLPVELTARRSADGGATWTDWPIEVDVPGNGRGVVVAGKPVRHRGAWLLPYSERAGAGVLRSSDLRTWRRGGLAVPPRGIGVGEPQVVLSQDDPDALLMVVRTLVEGTPEQKDAFYRTRPAYSATCLSRDGGLTWTPMVLDENLPNYYVKGFFTKDSKGRYVTIYNTLAGPFRGDRPDQHREVLHYKVKEPGRPWSPGRLFADGPRLTTGTARGWDVYASAEEESPGRLRVVWEHNRTAIRTATLDLATCFTGVRSRRGGLWEPGPQGAYTVTASGAGFAVDVGGMVLEWRDDGLYECGRRLSPSRPGPWRVLVDREGRATLLGTDLAWSARVPAGRVTVQGEPEFLEVTDCLAAWPRPMTLRGTSVTQPVGASDFTVEFLGEAIDGNLDTKVANGAKRLMLSIGRSEVRAMRKGSQRWERVHAHPGGPAVWRVSVDSAGVARLFRDGKDTGVSWVAQDSRERAHAAHWADGAARVEWSLVTATIGS